MPELTVEDCGFYQVLDLPGYGTTQGQWDFRKTEKEYLGNVHISGRRVLEIGTANGAHAFFMESLGAEVVAYDLSPENEWDLLLAEDEDEGHVREKMRNQIRRLNNGFLFCREKLGSKVKPAYGSIYKIPENLGDFDVITFGSVLLHVRDPIGALLKSVKRAREMVIITDRMPSQDYGRPLCEFIPKPELKKEFGGWTWWWISPRVYSQVFSLLGFSDVKVSTSLHYHVPSDKHIELFTLVAKP